MSATSLPITPTLGSFLSALENLSVSQLHLESHRLLNSIYHLRRSNITLLSDDFSSDPDCQDAVRENEEVIRRQEARVAMIRSELEKRGFTMEHGDLGEKLGGAVVSGEVTNDVVNVNGEMNDDGVVGGGGGGSGGGVVDAESRVQGNTEAVRGSAPTAVRVEEGQDTSGVVIGTEPPSQPHELDSVSHPAPTEVVDDGVYL